MTDDDLAALDALDRVRALPRFDRAGVERALGVTLTQVGVVRATIWAAEPPRGPLQRVEFHDPLEPQPGARKVPSRVNLVFRAGLSVDLAAVRARHPDGALERVSPHIGAGRETWAYATDGRTMSVGYDGPARRLVAAGFTRSEGHPR